jgi:pyruvate dehydrogenase E1 component beta subunit
MVPASVRAAEALAGEDVDVEVIDIRSIQPLDTRSILDSVDRTGRLVTVHESWITGGLGAEVVAGVIERLPRAIRVARVGTAAVPTPSGKVRPHALPNTDGIIQAIRRVMA